jgi:hypothetical protein
VSATRLAVTGTVNPPPTATSLTASAATICAGASVTLTAAGSDGATAYSFDDGTTWQTAATKSVSPGTTTTYTLKVRSAPECVSSDSKTVTVTVVATPDVPSVSQNGPTCAGTAVTFTASGGSGSYQWNDASSSTGAQYLSPITAGIYNVQARSLSSNPVTPCDSEYSPVTTGVVRARTVENQRPAAGGCCEVGLSLVDGVCTSTVHCGSCNLNMWTQMVVTNEILDQTPCAFCRTRCRLQWGAGATVAGSYTGETTSTGTIFNCYCCP